MRTPRISAFDVTVEPRLFAFLFAVVMLLTVFDKSLRSLAFRPVAAYPIRRLIALDGAVSRVQLLQDFASRFSAMPAFSVILSSLLNALPVLHQACFLQLRFG